MGKERPRARPLPPAGGGRASGKPAESEGGRAHGLGPRWPLIALAAIAVLALALLGAALGGLFSSGGAAASGAQTHRAADSAKYGGLPSWLPKPKMSVNRVVSASAAHPALAIQGSSVEVETPQGHVLATAVGPETPEQGRFPVPATSPCTFVVTFARPSAAIPLDAASFELVDEFGHVRHPRLSAISGGPPPRQLEPGHTLSVRMYDVLPTGDGALEWTPAGRRPTVAWDFDVEID
jgi:hypothetical protein